MSECIHGRLKRQCNECDLQEENQQLKARIAKLEHKLKLISASATLGHYKDIFGIYELLNESPQQSLAAIQADAVEHYLRGQLKSVQLRETLRQQITEE